ncbi:hypothetical protein Vi05172_g11647 [Venturia inaequalis]|nr:hypothetical protein Vi05172_g11647 [Venturia inaequalis]
MPEPNLLHRLWASTVSFLAQPPPPPPQHSTITSHRDISSKPPTDPKINIILTLLLALFLLSTLLILLLSKLIHTAKYRTLTHLDICITDRLDYDYVPQDRHKIRIASIDIDIDIHVSPTTKNFFLHAISNVVIMLSSAASAAKAD